MFAAMILSCRKPVEPIFPIAEVQNEVQTCNLQAQAIVQYREAHNGLEPFYFLTILDESGRMIADVYTSSIQDGKIQVGETVAITYHYEIPNGNTYVSTCGHDPENQPTRQQMAEVFVCNMSGRS